MVGIVVVVTIVVVLVETPVEGTVVVILAPPVDVEVIECLEHTPSLAGLNFFEVGIGLTGTFS